ncbi:glycosyltransferase [Niallia alba]|uniref:glycosyltransferase n=1 Tax=Niallia alba TaxID=2729105 RepID=UPI0039A19452
MEVNYTPVFIFKSLNIVRGGLTKAILTRANTLIKYYNQVYILTLSFQPDFEDILQELYSTGRLDKRVQVFNCFHDLSKKVGDNKVDIKEPKNNIIKEEGLYEFIDKGNELPSYRYYKNGVYIKYKRFDKKGRLVFVDYMSESRNRTRRDEYDKNGYLVCSQFMDPINNSPRLKSYYAKNGKCYMTVWIDDYTKKEGRSLLYEPTCHEFKSLYKLFTFWVQEKLEDIENPVAFSDSRFSDGLVLDLKVENIKRVAVLHNNHYSWPYNTRADTKQTWKSFLNRIHEYDKVIFLTNDQKKDIGTLVGNLPTFDVIPHAVPEMKVATVEKYNPKLVVYLARFESQKRIDEAIKAFKYVVKKIPDAQLHIYGFGPQKVKLEALIEELNLKKNIMLQEFTNAASAVYQSAACSILTSDYEGFGMVITESMAVGTPVVSYNCKYGPSDIIRDGIDGFLVPCRNKKKLAEKVVKILSDDDTRNQLSKNALEVNERFNYQKYEERWIRAINS